MNNTVRLVVGLVGVAVLAALAVPEVSTKLGVAAPAIAAALAAVLRQMDAKTSCDDSSSPSS